MTVLSVYQWDGQPIISTDRSKVQALAPRERTVLAKGARFYTRYRSGRRLAVFDTPIEMIGERVGFLRILFDLSEFEQNTRVAIWMICGGLSLILIVMVLSLNLMLSHSVLQPVQELQSAIRKLRQGNLGEQVPVVTLDEIGEMAAAFNDMSARLKDQHQRVVDSGRARDVSAEQLAESNRKLERLNADLESRVDERTRQLRISFEKLQEEIAERERASREKKVLEERLARSRKMEALGLLAGGVAHDLNNVLSGIVSYPDLLLMELPEPSRLRRPIETMRASGQKAAAIVQDLLTLARRGVTNTAVVNLNDDVIQDYLDSPEHQKLLAFHPLVQVEVRLADDLLNIRGSSIHLRKTVMNLVSNAAEAQPHGGKICISTENRYVETPIGGYDQVDEGDYVFLQVSDVGDGIAPEDMDRIFEPFYTKKKMGRSGTGLGMAVVWGTVQDHRGYINLVSEPGEGTTFELYFPATREKRAARGETVPLVQYTGEGESILVIDDVAEQREIASTLLEKLNYRVSAVESGEKALAYLHDRRVDLLVLDMIMAPGMDGLETYRCVKEILPTQKAIIASGFAESGRVRKAQAMGAGAYIRKPYTLEKIGLAVRDELQRPFSSAHGS